jgi:hypothetical protein
MLEDFPKVFITLDGVRLIHRNERETLYEFIERIAHSCFVEVRFRIQEDIRSGVHYLVFAVVELCPDGRIVFESFPCN